MKNLIVNNWKTTLVALVGFLVTIFVTAGTLTPEEGNQFSALITKLVTNVETLIATIMGIVLLFAKDYDSKE